MPEIIGLALLIFVIVVGAIAYLAMYYLRYRWELQGLREALGRMGSTSSGGTCLPSNVKRKTWWALEASSILISSRPAARSSQTLMRTKRDTSSAAGSRPARWGPAWMRAAASRRSSGWSPGLMITPSAISPALSRVFGPSDEL